MLTGQSLPCLWLLASTWVFRSDLRQKSEGAISFSAKQRTQVHLPAGHSKTCCRTRGRILEALVGRAKGRETLPCLQAQTLR